MCSPGVSTILGLVLKTLITFSLFVYLNAEYSETRSTGEKIWDDNVQRKLLLFSLFESGNHFVEFVIVIVNFIIYNLFDAVAW